MESNKKLHAHLKKVLADKNANKVHKSGARLMQSIHDEFTKWRLADIERVSAEDLAHAWVSVVAHMSLELVFELGGPEVMISSCDRMGIALHRQLMERSIDCIITAEMMEDN